MQSWQLASLGGGSTRIRRYKRSHPGARNVPARWHGMRMAKRSQCGNRAAVVSWYHGRKVSLHTPTNCNCPIQEKLRNQLKTIDKIVVKTAPAPFHPVVNLHNGGRRDFASSRVRRIWGRCEAFLLRSARCSVRGPMDYLPGRNKCKARRHLIHRRQRQEPPGLYKCVSVLQRMEIPKSM